MQSVCCDGEMQQPAAWESPKLSRFDVFYHIEQWNTTFISSKLPVVLKCLVGVFQRLSFQTNFQSNPISATCLSIELIELVVQSWQSTNDPTKAVLEVQKLAGDSMGFIRCARAILEAVDATNDSKIGNSCLISPISSMSRSSRMRLATASVWSNLEMPTDENAKISTFDVIRNMIKLRLTQSTLDYIWGLVDGPATAADSTALILSKSIMSPTSDVEMELSRFLLEIICEGEVSVFTPSSPHDEELVPITDIGLETTAMHKALATLSRSMRCSCAIGTNELKTFLRVHCKHRLIPRLAVFVKSAKNFPHLAFFATTILSALCTAIPETSTRLLSKDDVEMAFRFGVAAHQALALACDELLMLM